MFIFTLLLSLLASFTAPSISGGAGDFLYALVPKFTPEKIIDYTTYIVNDESGNISYMDTGIALAKNEISTGCFLIIVIVIPLIVTLLLLPFCSFAGCCRCCKCCCCGKCEVPVKSKCCKGCRIISEALAILLSVAGSIVFCAGIAMSTNMPQTVIKAGKTMTSVGKNIYSDTASAIDNDIAGIFVENASITSNLVSTIMSDKKLSQQEIFDGIFKPNENKLQTPLTNVIDTTVESIVDVLRILFAQGEKALVECNEINSSEINDIDGWTIYGCKKNYRHIDSDSTFDKFISGTVPNYEGLIICKLESEITTDDKNVFTEFVVYKDGEYERPYDKENKKGLCTHQIRSKISAKKITEGNEDDLEKALYALFEIYYISNETKDKNKENYIEPANNNIDKFYRDGGDFLTDGIRSTVCGESADCKNDNNLFKKTGGVYDSPLMDLSFAEQLREIPNYAVDGIMNAISDETIQKKIKGLPGLKDIIDTFYDVFFNNEYFNTEELFKKRGNLTKALLGTNSEDFCRNLFGGLRTFIDVFEPIETIQDIGLKCELWKVLETIVPFTCGYKSAMINYFPKETQGSAGKAASICGARYDDHLTDDPNNKDIFDILANLFNDSVSDSLKKLIVDKKLIPKSNSDPNVEPEKQSIMDLVYPYYEQYHEYIIMYNLINNLGIEKTIRYIFGLLPGAEEYKKLSDILKDNAFIVDFVTQNFGELYDPNAEYFAINITKYIESFGLDQGITDFVVKAASGVDANFFLYVGIGFGVAACLLTCCIPTCLSCNMCCASRKIKPGNEKKALRKCCNCRNCCRCCPCFTLVFCSLLPLFLFFFSLMFVLIGFVFSRGMDPMLDSFADNKKGTEFFNSVLVLAPIVPTIMSGGDIFSTLSSVSIDINKRTVDFGKAKLPNKIESICQIDIYDLYFHDRHMTEEGSILSMLNSFGVKTYVEDKNGMKISICEIDSDEKVVTVKNISEIFADFKTKIWLDIAYSMDSTNPDATIKITKGIEPEEDIEYEDTSGKLTEESIAILNKKTICIELDLNAMSNVLNIFLDKSGNSSIFDLLGLTSLLEVVSNIFKQQGINIDSIIELVQGYIPFDFTQITQIVSGIDINTIKEEIINAFSSVDGIVDSIKNIIPDEWIIEDKNNNIMMADITIDDNTGNIKFNFSIPALSNDQINGMKTIFYNQAVIVNALNNMINASGESLEYNNNYDNIDTTIYKNGVEDLATFVDGEGNTMELKYLSDYIPDVTNTNKAYNAYDWLYTKKTVEGNDELIDQLIPGFSNSATKALPAILGFIGSIRKSENESITPSLFINFIDKVMTEGNFATTCNYVKATSTLTTFKDEIKLFTLLANFDGNYDNNVKGILENYIKDFNYTGQCGISLESFIEEFKENIITIIKNLVESFNGKTEEVDSEEISVWKILYDPDKIPDFTFGSESISIIFKTNIERIIAIEETLNATYNTITGYNIYDIMLSLDTLIDPIFNTINGPISIAFGGNSLGDGGHEKIIKNYIPDFTVILKHILSYPLSYITEEDSGNNLKFVPENIRPPQNPETDLLSYISIILGKIITFFKDITSRYGLVSPYMISSLMTTAVTVPMDMFSNMELIALGYYLALVGYIWLYFAVFQTYPIFKERLYGRTAKAAAKVTKTTKKQEVSDSSIDEVENKIMANNEGSSSSEEAPIAPQMNKMVVRLNSIY